MLFAVGCERSSDSSLDSLSADMQDESEWFDDRPFGDNDPNLVLAVGDSVTEGSAITGLSYPTLVASFSGKYVINEGVGGTMSSYGLERFEAWLTGYQPGYVMILYGINDIIHVNDLDWTLANLRTMVQKAHANRTVAIVGTLPPRLRPDIGWDHRHITLNQRIRLMVEEENARLADVELAFGWNANLLQVDGYHPNEAGNRVIAATFDIALTDEF